MSGHMSFSFLVLAPVALRDSWEVHRRTLEKQWKGIVYIGAFMALNIALNNISLLDISLTLNQIIRCGWWRRGGAGSGWVAGHCHPECGPPPSLAACRAPAPLLPTCLCRSAIPVVTCLLAIGVESKWPTRTELTALVTLTVGVMLAVWQGALFGKPYAIAFCIAGTVCNGAMMTFSGKLLRWVGGQIVGGLAGGRQTGGRASGGGGGEPVLCRLLPPRLAASGAHTRRRRRRSRCCCSRCCSDKLDVVRLTFYTAPVSLACLAPFYWIYEVSPLPLLLVANAMVTPPLFSLHLCPPNTGIRWPALQRENFYEYLPSHTQGVAFIIIVSSINAVCYNMVRAGARGEGGGGVKG